MLYFTIRRLGLAVLVALTVSILAFLLLHLSGDPALALAGEGARQADIDMSRKTYGLDRPLAVQYADWLWHILRGDFGTSVYFKTEAGPLILSSSRPRCSWAWAPGLRCWYRSRWACWPPCTRAA